MKIKAVIQARVGATRLPGKVMMKVLDKPILEYVIERVNRAKLIDEVIVATTENKEDLPIVDLAARLDVRVYCGSENDVLDRFYQAAKLFKIKNIVRITSDCPLIDPDIIDMVIEKHINAGADYTANIIKETYPDGEDVEVFTFESLKRAWRSAKLASEREHVTPYIRKHIKLFKIVNIECDDDLSNKRWTIDEPADYEFVIQIYQALYHKNPFFGMRDILEFLKIHPEIEEINHHISRNEGYLKSVIDDKLIGSEYPEEK